MTIIEYILDPQDKPRSYHPQTIPSYVSDGGYFINPDGSEKRIGVGVEGNIPDTTETFTLGELQARQLAIHAEHPMYKHYPNDADYMTNDEVNLEVKEWWDARN